jgi:hypothetical protein
LIPILILYLVFGAKNFFNLKGWPLGVFATGPIAAYVFMVYLGFRMFRNTTEILLDIRTADMADFVGRWEVESRTIPSGKMAHGSLIASQRRGQIAMNGLLYGDGGEWDVAEAASEFCYLDRDRGVFKMFYRLDNVDARGRHISGDCLCSLTLIDELSDALVMKGSWVQVGGNTRYSGPVTFRKNGGSKTVEAES